MRTQLNRKGVACNATTLAGFGLAMAFTFSSCSVSEDENNLGGGLQVQCPEGSTWNASAMACVSNPVAGSGCPTGTTLTLDAENNPICVWQAVEISSSSVGGGSSPSGNSSSSVGGTTTNPDDGTITVGTWTFKGEGDEGSTKTTGTPSTISITGSAGTVTANGTVRKGTGNDQYGYAMLIAWPNTDAENAKLRTANSVSFTAKGDGKTYFVELNTGDNYRKTFTASTAGNAVTVCFNDLTLPDWATDAEDFDASKLNSVVWQAHSENNVTNFNFTISNVSVGNNASCNGSTAGGTLVKPDFWWTYADGDTVNNEGTSFVNITENIAAGSVTASGELNQIPGKDFGFAGWGTTDTTNVISALWTATSISFKVVGDGKTYRMNLETSDVENSNLHQITFPTTAGVETTVTRNLSQFAQQNWGQAESLTLNKSHIKAIAFTPVGDGSFGPITISDITIK